MKSIYLLMTKSQTYVSQTIHYMTSDPYTHVSISFDRSLQPLYSFARKYTNSPLPAGIKQESFSEGFYKKNNKIPCALYELRVEDDVYDYAKKIVLEMMREADRYKYNLLGLILCRFNIVYQRDNHYFCSEFVGDILTKSQALCLPKNPSLMRPYDYAHINGLNCLFQGELFQLIENIAYV